LPTEDDGLSLLDSVFSRTIQLNVLNTTSEGSFVVAITTLRTLTELEQEMGRAGRTAEEEALREALRTLARRRGELLTTGEAAGRLGVSIPTVKRWIDRGTLVGSQMGGRWLVAPDSVQRLARLKASLVDLDQEGNPTEEEIPGIEHRSSRRAEGAGVSTRQA
jgi:excisionase family DNA binding protein